jgi:hypothetical protein
VQNLSRWGCSFLQPSKKPYMKEHLHQMGYTVLFYKNVRADNPIHKVVCRKGSDSVTGQGPTKTKALENAYNQVIENC